MVMKEFDEVLHEIISEQLLKEAKGEKTFLSKIPDDQFMCDEITFLIKLSYKDLFSKEHKKENLKIAQLYVQILNKLLEKRINAI